MANVVFPDGSAPLFNPAAYGEVSAEAHKTKSPVARRGKKSGDTKKSGFASFFEKIALGDVKELPSSEEALHELLDEVHNTGDMLSKRPFPQEIRAYKEAVRNFVHHVVKNAFDTEEQETGINILKRKKYTLVQVIDKKLEEMALAILRGQMQQMEILAKVDEIKGLLVDMMQ